MPKDYDIRTVAIYLRKSRGQNNEEIDDLKQHRAELISMCEERGWAFTEYAEIGTGDKISVRPKMLELLQDVEQQMYDAVVAVHFDRLSRGDEIDQARIKKTFAMTETLFVTPSRVYDYNNDQDIMMADFEGMMARLEYKTIARRFRQGKARRAKQGFWSNGKPPFPYVFNRETGKAEPDDANLLVYRRMIDLCFNGYATTDIAWEFNKDGIPSPRGQLWSPVVVRRLLMDEVHLGRIVVGKKRKLVGADAIVRKPKDEWIIYHNCHQPVKTEIEHNKILFLIQRQKETPPAARSGSNSFSGLIRCGICGHTMQIQKRSDRPSDHLKSCTHRDPFGNRCTNIGGAIIDIAVSVKEAILVKQKQLEDAIRNGIQLEDIRVLLGLSEQKLAEMKQYDSMLSKLEDTYFADKISEERYMLKKAEYERRIRELEEEYQIIQQQADNTQNVRNEDMLDSVKKVLEFINNPDLDPKDINRAYKSIIHSIEWERESLDEKGVMKVNFL